MRSFLAALTMRSSIGFDLSPSRIWRNRALLETTSGSADKEVDAHYAMVPSWEIQFK
jgi:hypothetical protein